MIATVVQSASVSTAGGGATTLTATWPSTTTAGNLLIGLFAYAGTASSAGTLTLPTGWLSINGEAGNTNCRVNCFALSEQQSTARSGGEVISWVNTKKAVLIIAEIKTGIPPRHTHAGTGATAGYAVDPSGSGSYNTTGTSTTVGSTPGLTLEKHLDLTVVGHVCVNADTFTAPTTNHTIAAQIQGAGSGGAATKISAALIIGAVEGVGTTTQCQTTLGTSREWGSQIFGIGALSIPQSNFDVGY